MRVDAVASKMDYDFIAVMSHNVVEDLLKFTLACPAEEIDLPEVVFNLKEALNAIGAASSTRANFEFYGMEKLHNLIVRN